MVPESNSVGEKISADARPNFAQVRWQTSSQGGILSETGGE
jgi:hypothetical protein